MLPFAGGDGLHRDEKIAGGELGDAYRRQPAGDNYLQALESFMTGKKAASENKGKGRYPCDSQYSNIKRRGTYTG